MSINRVSFAPIAQGGDTPTAALVKLDGNDADLDARLSSLGNASAKNVGTTAGTVAAGDDSRLAAVATKLDKTNPVITGSLTSDNGAIVVQPGTSGNVILRPVTNSSTGQATLASDGSLTVAASVSATASLARSGLFSGGDSGSANYAILQAAGFQGSIFLRPTGGSVNGQASLNASGNFTCVSVTQTSSADVKDYLQGYGGALDAIAKLVVLTYQYLDTYVSDGGRTRIGIIAENVADAIPQAVTPAQTVTIRIPDPAWDGTGDERYVEQTSTTPASVDPMQLVSVALRGIQELVGQVAALTARVAALEPPPAA